jgi:hypothetical protein
VLVGVRPSDVEAAAGILDVERLLNSLQLQKNPRWRALLYPLPSGADRNWSGRLLEDITRMTRRDPRIRRVGWELLPGVEEHTATEGAVLEGLRELAPSAEWILLTRGSGLMYKPDAFESLPGNVDVVGLGMSRARIDSGNATAVSCADLASDEGVCERNALTRGKAAIGTQLVKRAKVTESLSGYVKEFYDGNATGMVGEGKGWITGAKDGCHAWVGESPSACRAAKGVWLVGQRRCIDPLADNHPLYWQLTNATEDQYSSFVKYGTCMQA